ncbi:MAG: hypothetical protein H7321_05595 [Bacteroidia bacterium]|nr:hypothetical protein [Bacteroidia bacterium]
MIIYNPKDWFTFIFRLHKADTFRKLIPMMLIITIYSLIIAWVEKEYFHADENSPVKNISLIHTLLGFVLSMLLVFRTNTAYDRWWEGRKLWGQLTNQSRNFALKISSFLPEEDSENRKFFSHHTGLFAVILSRHLMSEKTRLALSENEHIREYMLESHPPAEVARIIMNRISELNKKSVITDIQILLLNDEIKGFMDVCGGCERIKNTPIPFSYSLFIKKFIFIYIITLPIGYAGTLGYWVAPLVAFALYVLGGLEIIAEEIEDPFNLDANDIPTPQIAENIAVSVKSLLINFNKKS